MGNKTTLIGVYYEIVDGVIFYFHCEEKDNHGHKHEYN